MKKINIVGGGLRSANQMTLEAISIIRSSSFVLVWGGLIEGITEILNDINPNWKDISSFYLNNADDTVNYQILNKKVIEAVREFDNLSIIVYGHPKVGVTFSQNIQELINLSKIEADVICYPGISSFDTMLIDKSLDPLEEGTCLVDANRLILYDLNMDTSLNYFIYHVCSIGVRQTDFVSPHETTKSLYLKEKLKKHYSLDHPLELLLSPTSNNSLLKITHGTINALEEILKNVSFSSTLFIPAKLPSIDRVNVEFYNDLIT
ncbi:SAM-dependent methyltransferase [Acinetobacter seifertii]|uniref:SAM-dependent methyltransferase n=1 Tax=Acinetobacter seifertii TaxID=1530123 RepID=UPI003AF4CA7F